MYITVTENMFIQEFKEYGREDQFSQDALIALYEQITELENDGADEDELDVIALCCEFTEYKSESEATKEYGIDDCLDDYTMVIRFKGGILVQNF